MLYQIWYPYKAFVKLGVDAVPLLVEMKSIQIKVALAS
jgi:hypothetical protein